MATQKKGGGSRKLGNNKKWCEVYRSTGRRESNKLLKMQRHLRHYPADDQCANRLRSLQGVGRGHS